MTEEKKPTTSPTPYLENLNAPEVFADNMPLFALNQGVVHMTFSTHRVSHAANPPHDVRVEIGRLAMPIPAAKAFAQNLWSFLQLHGIDPADKPVDAPPQ